MVIYVCVSRVVSVYLDLVVGGGVGSGSRVVVNEWDITQRARVREWCCSERASSEISQPTTQPTNWTKLSMQPWCRSSGYLSLYTTS